MSGATDLQPRYSPRFTVTVGDRRFQEPGGRIADLVVETTLDGADRFSFTLNYPFDEELGEFAGLEWDDFAVGRSVEIELGYGGDGALAPLFEGSIRTVEAEFAREKGPSVVISGYGLLWETMQGTASDSWEETTVGDAVSDVLSKYSFSTVEVSDADLKRQKLIQEEQSDYRFVSKLAEAYGFEFFAERDAVRFLPRSSVSGGDDPATELWYGEALHDFHATVAERRADHRVEVRAWDVQKKEEIVATAGASNARHTEVYRVPAMSRDEADTIAATKLDQLSNGVAEGHGEADGDPAIRAGNTVTLGELGGRFSGDYHVTKATHRMGGSGYRTTFEATEVSG